MIITLIPPADDLEAARRTICAERGHPIAAGCYNPLFDETFCRCGARREPGDRVELPILCPPCWYGDGPCAERNPCMRDTDETPARGVAEVISETLFDLGGAA